LWGKATLITRRHQEELLKETVEKFGILGAIRKTIKANMASCTDEELEAALDTQMDKITLIQIEAEKITHLLIRPGEGPEKLVWEKERT